MNENVERRRAFLINLLYFGVFLTLFYLIVKTFAWILMPFIIAILVAVILHRPVDKITRKTKIGRGPVSVVGVFLIILVIGGLITLLGFGIADKVKDFFAFLSGEIKHLGEYAEMIREQAVRSLSSLPASVSEKLTENVNEFFDGYIKDGITHFDISSFSFDWSAILSKGGTAIKDTVIQIPTIFIGFVVTIIASIFLTIDFNTICGFVMRQFKTENRKKIRDAVALSKKTFGDIAKAYSKLMALTFVEMCIGLGILKILNIYTSPYFVIIAVITAIVDIIPVLGTGTVLIPWAIISFIGGRISMGIGLLIMYLVILIVRQYIEPKLVSDQTGLPPIITITAMYLGTKILGVLGFFILPFIVVLIKKYNEAGILHWFVFSEKKENEVSAGFIERIKTNTRKKKAAKKNSSDNKG